MTPRAEPIGVDLAGLEERVRETVRAVAAVDPDPTDPFRGLYVSDDLARRLAGEAAAWDATGPAQRLNAAAALLGLDAVEAAVLALCAAPELDPRYARLFAYLHDDVTRKAPSPRLVATLLADGEVVDVATVLACFAHDRPLRRLGALRVVDADGPLPLADRGVRLADRLAAFLVGAELQDPSAGSVRRVDPGGLVGEGEHVQRLITLLGQPSGPPLVVAGPDAPAVVAAAGGRGLLIVAASAVETPGVLLDARLACLLEDRRLCIDGLEDVAPEQRPSLQRAARGQDGLVLLARSAAATTALGDMTTLVVVVPMPGIAEREREWAAASGCADARDVAAKFRLSRGQIAEAAQVARLAASTRGAEVPTPAELDLGARQASSSLVGELASRLTPQHGWDRLVLPRRQREHLASIAAHLRHRDRVLQEWGYERTAGHGAGVKALFAGESGTGKTMSAQVIAADLGVELYRVDLATIVSKYIGETEKNLDRIFDAAEGSNAILFFDEADALFGKRSEVSDAHDRYANIEVAYLLQKMEGYDGAVVLATNFQRNIDDAFLRRLDYVVDFPFPDVEDRRRIWALLLPPTAPLAGDVDLDFLAERFRLAGGAIRNCALGAAYLAAAEGDEVTMRHLVRAVALEYAKLGRLTIEADFERFHEELRVPTSPGGPP